MRSLAERLERQRNALTRPSTTIDSRLSGSQDSAVESTDVRVRGGALRGFGTTSVGFDTLEAGESGEIDLYAVQEEDEGEGGEVD